MAGTQRVAIVTGSSRGIGAAIARRLAADGCAVVLNYSASRSRADEVVDGILEDGGVALAVKADVASAAEVKNLFEAAEMHFGAVDVVVNNAAIMLLGNVAEFGDDQFDRQIATNLKGTFNTMREAGRRLREGGRIINFSTSVVGLYHPGYACYAASKAGVEAMTRVMAKEMRGRGICVNAVAPGPTATEMFLEGKTEERIGELAMLTPLERLGQPEDIAGVVSFLAGEDGGWFNGQVLRANGGII